LSALSAEPLDRTGRISSVPLLVSELFWSTHASAAAGAVVGEGQAEDAETVHWWVAGVGSVLPAGSVARTWKSCRPGASPVYGRGEVHAVKGAPSRAHSNVDPVSLAEKMNVAVVMLVGWSGRESMVVSGGVVSAWIVQANVAGVGSVFPAGSVARTWKVRDPSARSA
jgi:hypothetical protein